LKVKSFIKNFIDSAYFNTLDELHLILSNLGLDNLNGQIVTLTMPPGVDISIPHRLKRVPKYRIILRKTASGEILDGSKKWTSSVVYLRNSGVVSSTVTMFIL